MTVETLIKRLKEEKKTMEVFILIEGEWYPIDCIMKVLGDSPTILIQPADEPI